MILFLFTWPWSWLSLSAQMEKKQHKKTQNRYVCVFRCTCMCVQIFVRVPYGLEQNEKYYTLLLKAKNLRNHLFQNTFIKIVKYILHKALILNVSYVYPQELIFFTLICKFQFVQEGGKLYVCVCERERVWGSMKV